MAEETRKYLWATQDILGHGATSQVYKAYDKSTGEVVAAKVYQMPSNVRPAAGANQNRERDFRPILDREMEILKGAHHENIVRYIALEPVIPLDGPPATSSREALVLEYCNGGSLHSVLELPENRYGLAEDDFMLLFRHLTNALRYLHDKNTVSEERNSRTELSRTLFACIQIHRDIKPDNIMLSININGERTFKLADLGVARIINTGESAFTSLVGTEEYIHPDLYKCVPGIGHLFISLDSILAQQCLTVERMDYERPLKHASTFHSKWISGRWVWLSFNVPRVRDHGDDVLCFPMLEWSRWTSVSTICWHP